MNVWFSRSALLAAILAALPAVAALPEEAALAEVRRSNREVMTILAEQPELTAHVERRIDMILDRVTDFAAMSAAAGTGFTDGVSEAQRERFHRAFRTLLRNSALRRMGRYRADRVEYGEPSSDGPRARVPTTAWYGGDRVAIDYTLEPGADGRWRIVNYTVDGIDTIRNYRRQFARILRSESFEDLVKRLERRASEPERP